VLDKRPLWYLLWSRTTLTISCGFPYCEKVFLLYVGRVIKFFKNSPTYNITAGTCLREASKLLFLDREVYILTIVKV
jgi:hypothetical protein